MVTIVKAAVMHQGRIYVGVRHGCIMQDIWANYPHERIAYEDQGFLTSDGRFVSRWQAGAIAFRAGQTKTRIQQLCSEDLW